MIGNQSESKKTGIIIPRMVIDFEKVKTVEDICLIFEALDLSWNPNHVPETVRHLMKRKDYKS